MQTKVVAHDLADRVLFREGISIQGIQQSRQSVLRQIPEIRQRTQPRGSSHLQGHHKRQQQELGQEDHSICLRRRAFQRLRLAAWELH